MRKKKAAPIRAKNSRSFLIKFASAITIVAILVSWLIYAKHNVEAGWYGNNTSGNGAWTTRKKIIINKSKVVGSSALANYPMLVSITDADLAAKAQSNGNDILFTSSDGTTKLDHEIESYTSTTGTLVAWVEIPSLSPAANTVIYMYYGNSSVSSQQNATGVWDSNYRFVQHMEETSGTTMTDSSPAGKNGTKLSATEPNPLSSGKINGAQTFDATNDSVEILDSTNPTAYTIEGWVRLTDNTSVQIMGRTNSGGMGSHSHELRINSSSKLQNYLYDGSARSVNGTTTLQTGIWYYVVGTATNNGNMYVYVNGVSEGTPTAIGTMWTGGDRYHISDPAFGDGYGFLNGDLDELRFSSSVRTPEWIATNYNNQSSPSTFYTVTNTPEQNPTTILNWRFDEGSGTAVNDSSSYNHTGVLSGTAPSWEVQNKGSNKFSLKFNGSTNYVSKTYSSTTDTDLNPGTASMTVSSWFRHSSAISGQDTLIARFATGGYKVYMKSSGVMCFGVDDATSSTWGTNSSGTPDDETCSITSYADSQWHFIEAVKNGTTSITLYIDGRQVGTADTSITSNSISGSTPAFYVGIDADGTSNAWDGFIDEVKVQNIARSVSDVKADYSLQGNIKGVSATFGQKGTENLTDGLVGWWKMDDNVTGNNQTITDSSGNNNNGTTNYGANTTGMDCTVGGKFGKGCNFDGTDDYVNTGSGISLSNKSFTLAGWVKRAYGSGTIETLFYQGTNQDSIALYIGDDDAIGCVFRNADNPTGIGNALISDANWHQLVCTFDTNTKKLSLYIDGNPDSAFTSNYTISASGTMYIGEYIPTSMYSSGKFDDLRVYNRALSATEVSQLYSWGPEPVGYWKLDEGNANSCGSTNDSCDSSGNNNNGDWYGDAAPTTAKYSKGVRFDGNDDYIKIPHSTSLNFQSATTLEAWVYPTSTTGTQVVVGKQPIDGSGNYWFLRQNTSAYQCIVDSGGNYSDPGSVYVGSGVILNTWQHVACSFDGTVIKVYVNGILKGSANYTGTVRTSLGPVHIGNNGSLVQDFNGRLDDIRVYNYARTGKQIIQDMNAGHPAVTSPVGSPLVHYKFDEGYSTTANNSGNVSGYNGTLTTMSSPATATSGWTKAGKVNSALLFDGGDDYVTRADSGASDSLRLNGYTEVSMSAWIKIANLADSSEHQIIGKYSHGGATGYTMLVYNTGAIGFKINGAANAKITSTTPISAGTWYHIACVFANGNTMKVYLNGRLLETFSISATSITASSNPLVVGTASDAPGDSSWSFSGAIDEAKIYGYAISDDEVQVDYNQGKSAVLGAVYVDPTGVPSFSTDKSYCVPGDSSICNAPTAEWKFDERTGTSANDTSGNANTVTLASGTFTPTWKAGYAGSSLYFNGANYATTSLNLSNTNVITLEFWMRWDSYANDDSLAMEFTNNPGVNTGGFLIDPNSSNTGTSKFEIGLRGDVGWSNILIARPTAGIWHHYTFILDKSQPGGSEVTPYVDGVLQTYTTVTSSNNTNNFANSTLYFMERYDNTLFGKGSIDTVRIYNYARSPAQVAWDYNRGGSVAWYKFDECSGDTIYDSSGNNLNGSLTYSTSGNTAAGTCSSGNTSEMRYNGRNGKINNGLHFDGINDYYQVNDNSAIRIGSQITLSGWFNVNDTSADRPIIAKPNEYLVRFNSDDSFSFFIYDGSSYEPRLNAAVSPSAGVWHHFAAVYDSTLPSNQMKLYIDGRLSAQQNRSITVSGTSNSVLNNFFGTYFDGILDDIRIYKYALTPQQIKTLYNGDTAVQFAPVTGTP